MSIADHRPHVPWGGVVGIIRRHRDDDETPTIELTDTSIHEWLASGDRAPSAAELTPGRVPAMPQLPAAPAMYRPNTGPDDVSGVSKMPFTVHRELDDDEALAGRLLRMERQTQSLADQLAAENDTRLQLLVAHSRAFGERWARTRLAMVFGRRREQIRELVPALGHLLAAGDVSQATAARVMSLRSQYLSAADSDSQRLPRMTPELLAAMDAERVAGAA